MQMNNSCLHGDRAVVSSHTELHRPQYPDTTGDNTDSSSLGIPTKDGGLR